jgi:hypothetical protein
MKKLLLLIVLILLIAVYIAGYWPQHQQVEQLQHNAGQLQQQLSTAQSAARLCQLENESLDLLDQAKAQNYGDAQKLAGKFFNDLQAEVSRSPNAPYTQTLLSILASRDAVVASLARADASTVTILQQNMDQIRQIAQQLASQAAS